MRALSTKPEEREAYVSAACGGDSELLALVRDYVRAEQEMAGFLERPALEGFQWNLPEFDETVFEPGEMLADRFRIIRRVAEGGMGVVYEARDERLCRPVALKCAKAGFGRRLPPEARHASVISHPNVCRIFEIHTAKTARGDVDFLTMEFLDGETLAERLRRGTPARAEVNSISDQLCAGLAEAHRNHVIHGDLKSNNVILTRGPEGALRAVITDFGLANMAAGALPGAHGMASAPVGGAAAYMAPELKKGAKPSAASDVYALGVMLSGLVSGQRGRLFQAKWRGILARCLQADPARRFEDGTALLRAVRPSLTRRWAVGALAAVLLAALLSGTITFERAAAPKQTVRLALTPFEASGNDGGAFSTASTAARLTRDTGETLARLRGDSRTNVVFLQGAPRTATHVFRGRVESDGEFTVLRLSLTDVRSGSGPKNWVYRYRAEELKYAPLAVAGLVTSSLRLPPVVPAGTLNAAARADYRTALSYVKGNRDPEASVRLMERVVAADPDSALSYAGLAEAQWFRGYRGGDASWKQRAQESAREAELRNPDLPEIHMISGWLEENSGHYERAEAHLQRAIALAPASDDAWRRLGETYESAGRLDEAQTALKMAVRLGPAEFRNHLELGSYLLERGQFADAVSEFQKAVSLSPGTALPRRALGQAFAEEKKYEAAVAELEAAIKIEDSSDSEQILAAILSESGNNGSAIGHYERALTLGRESSSLWWNVALCYEAEGLHGKAKHAFGRGLAAAEKALAEDPRNGRERANEAYFDAKLGQPRRAETDIGQALQLSQDDDTIQMAVFTWEALGRRDESMRLLAQTPSILADVAHYPELRDLARDPGFVRLLKVNHVR